MKKTNMTNIKPIFFAVLAFVAAMNSSCSKEYDAQQIQNDNEEERGQICVSVKGLLGDFAQDEGSKSTMVNTVRVKWVEGDKVYAYDETEELGELTVSLKPGNDSFAVLNGTISAPSGNKIFLVHGNRLAAAPAISDGKITFDLSSQTSEKGAYANAPFIAYGTMVYSGKDKISDQVVDFKFASSIMRLNCTGLEPNVKVTTAKLVGISNQCVINFSGGNAAVENGQTGDISFSFTNLTASGNGAQVFYASIAKTEGNENQILEISNAVNNTYEWGFGQQQRNGGASFNAVCQMKKLLPFTVGMNEDGTRRTVRFAPGNLYCVRSDSEGNWTYTFGFEANQWDYRCFNGYDNDKAVLNGVETTTPANTSGLFQWVSESCTDEGAAEARRSFGAFSELTLEQISTGATVSDIVEFGKAFGDDSSWRTLTKDEWIYLDNNQKIRESGTIHGVEGFIIFYDDYVGDKEGLTYIPEGCVFIPKCGLRSRNDSKRTISSDNGQYWARLADEDLRNAEAINLNTWLGYGLIGSPHQRDHGLPVRLVSDFSLN